MRNRLELADLGRLQAGMLLDRNGHGVHERAAAMLEDALSAYRPSGCPPTPLRQDAYNGRRRPKGPKAPSAERPVTV
jgi:hypothetical protein